MATRDLVVVGASAGGVEALKLLASRLPEALPATIFVVLHIPASAESVLPEILMRSGPLVAKRAVHGEKYERGHIYVAPPDHHLLLVGDRMRLTRGPRVNGHRPAVDPLFRSAARQFGPRVIGVILSGVLDDGTAGAMTIKQRGGVVVVQAPSDALHPGMPTSALEHVAVDHTASAVGIGGMLAEWVREEVKEQVPPLNTVPEDVLELEERNEEELAGSPSMFTCPECHGALWVLEDDDVLRFRCHVGHAYGPESLLAHQSERLEEAMWTAYRALRESATLAKRLAMRASAQGLDSAAKEYEARHDEAMSQANLLRNVLARGQFAGEGTRS